MKLNLKRFLAYLLTVLMLVSVVPTSAIAEITAASNASASIHSIMPDQDVYVTFKFYAGEELVDTQIVKNDSGSVTEPKTPEKAGQKFLGWFDESGNKYENFGAVTGYTTNTTVKLTAKFEEKIYHVYFLSVDGEEVVATRDASEATGWKVDLPTDYEPQDKRVTGWIYNGGEFTKNTVVTEDVYVSPVTVDCYWVTFDAQGGEVVTSKSVDKGSTLNLSGITSKKTGYTLKGWALTPDGATVSSVTPTEKVTLYAIWEAANVNYTVVYWGENANDTEFGTFLGTETKSAKTGSSVTVSSSQAKKIDYFTYKESDQNVEVKADGSTVVNVRYTRNVYKVTFDLHQYNDWGDDVTPKGATMTVDGTSYTKSGTKYVLKAKYEQNIENLWPTAANFDKNSNFRGWNVPRPGQNIEQISKVLTLTGDFCVSGGLTVKALYDATCLDHLYYMFESFDQTSPENGNERKFYNGLYYDKSTAYSQDANSAGGTWNQKEISGMTAVGTDQEILKKSWGGLGYIPTERNVFLYYNRIEYDLVKNNYGVIEKKTLKFGAPLDDEGGEPARPAGFTEKAEFQGWYSVPVSQITESTLPFKFEGATLPINGLTLYAYWVDQPVTLTVKAEGFDTTESEKPAFTKISDFASFQEMETAINTAGKSVLKWYIEGDASKTRIDTELAIGKDTTIVAVFVGTTYQITYNAGKGSGEVKDDYKYAPDSYAKVKSGNGLTAPAGYAFAYWTDVDGNRYYPGSKIKMVGDIELTAVYTPVYEKVTLTYHSNFAPDETKTTEPTLVNGQVTILRYSETTLPTRAGYTFTGWNTKTDGTGDRFAESSNARLDADGNNDLYAQWTANENTEYTVEFYYQNDDGTTYPADPRTTETRTGKTDTTASVTDVDKADKENGKYTLDGNQGNVFEGIIAGDGSLVLKLYFKLNTAEYTIHHYLMGTEVKVADDETGTMTIGQKLKAHASNELYPQYANATADSESLKQEITIAATGNVITVYYTVPLTITADSASKAYDGTELKKGTFTVEGRVNGDTAEKFTLSMTAGSTITDVGSEPNVIDRSTVKYNGEAIPSYYTVTYVDGTLTITASEAEVIVTIVGNTKTETYDGTEQSVTGYTVKSISNDLYKEEYIGFTGTATAKGTDADTYQMGLSKDDFENKSSNFSKVTFVVTDGWLKIDPKPLTITAGSDEKVYDGKPLTKNSYTSSGLAAGDNFESVTVTGSITEVGSVDNVASDAVIKRGEKDVTGNYAITYEKGTLKVTPVTTEVVVTILGNTKTETYDGTEKTAEGYTVTTNNSLYTEDNFEFNGTKVVKATDASANSYPMGLKVGDFENKSSNFTNVKFVVTDGSLTINPIAIELTAKSAEKEYDGTPLTDDGYEITSGEFVKGEGLESVTVEGSQTLVGSSANTITDHALKTGTKAQNYAITYKPGTLTVKNRTTQYEITVKANSGEKVYDGKELKVQGFETLTFTVNGLQYTVEGLTASKTGTNVSDSGAVEVKGTAIVKDANDNDVTAQFKVTTVNGLLTIKPKEVTITAEDATKVYDGKALTQPKFTATALEEGDTHEFVVKMTEGSTITNVGTKANVIATVDGADVKTGEAKQIGNYLVTTVEGKLEVTAKAVTITAEDATKVYDGKALTQPKFTATALEAGDTHEFTVAMTADSTITNVGTKANVIATVDGVAVKTGEAKQIGNYLVTTVEGKLEVTAKAVTIIAEDATKVYDGKALTQPKFTATALEEGDTHEFVVKMTEDSTITNVGTKANVIATVDGETVKTGEAKQIGNYLVTTVEGKLEVTAKAVTITAEDATKEYDGNALTQPKFTATALEAGDTHEFTVVMTEDSTITNVGTQPNVIATVDGEAVTTGEAKQIGNYLVTTVAGTLTITKRGAGDEKVKVIANSDTVTYDGQAHGEDGYTTERLVEGHRVSTVTIDGSKTDVGTYTDLLVPHDAKIVDAQGNDVTKNYEITYVAGTLKIEPKKVTITAEDATKVYDGKALTQSEFTTTALEEGDTHEFKVAMTADSKITNVGTQPNVIATVDGEDVTTGVEKQIGNYLVTTANGTLEVTPVTDEVVVKIVGKTKTETYDGTEKKVEGYTVTIDNDLYTEDDFEFSGTAYAEGTNADTYPMGLKAEQFKNVSANFTNVRFDVTDGWLKIDPRKVTLTSGSGEKVYDGTPLMNNTVTVSGDGFADGEGAIYDVTGSQLNVGESENKFTYALKDDMVPTNYEITTEFGTLKVTPVTDEVVVTITGREDSAQYDGAKHSVSGYNVAISNALYTEDCFEFGGKAVAEGVHAGEYAMGLNEKQFKNVSANFTNVKFVIERDGRLTIEQRALIITAGSYEGDYDGEWHGVGYTAEGLAETDKITALTMKDDAILYPGELTASFLPETLKITHADGTDSTGDYRVEYMPGKLVVNTVIVKYRVQYYYDGVLYGGATEEGTGEVLTKITEYRDKPRDMMFDHVDNFPLTLGLNEEENVIRVYYVHIPLTGYLGAHNVGDCIE